MEKDITLFPILPDWDKWLPPVNGTIKNPVKVELDPETAEFIDMFRHAQKEKMTRRDAVRLFLRERTRYVPPHTLLLFRWLARVSTQLAASLPDEERAAFVARVRPAIENLCDFLQSQGFLRDEMDNRGTHAD